MTDLTIGGETFRVSVEGDPTRPPLMLSNSLGTNLSMWDGQLPVFTRHFRVIRYDPRGHGGSIGPDAPTSVGQLGRDALAILDALEIETVHWLGLSMGGAVGLWLLVNAPDRIDRAVLANTAARLGTAETWNARITSVLAHGMAENATATIERWFSPEYKARAPERVEAIHAMLRGTSAQGYASACGALRDMDLRASLGGIRQKVLVVTGRDDPVIPGSDADALITGIAGARHAKLEARHMSNIEAEAEFNAAVLAFLTQRSRKTERAPNAATTRKPTAKAAPVKRGGAGRRSNPARNPLKKAPAKRAAADKPGVRKARPAAKTPAAHRRPAAKRSSARPASKVTPKRQAPKKAAAKTLADRRPTPTATARRPVKKAKPVKRGAAKSAAKKATVKAPAKKLPATRRKPTKKPRRPKGRRNP